MDYLSLQRDGEDILYMEYSAKISEALKTGTPGKSIADFLNHWRMRVPSY